MPLVISLLNECGGSWVFTGEGDDAISELRSPSIRLHPIRVLEEDRSAHYDAVSVGLLLRLLHYSLNASVEPIHDKQAEFEWQKYVMVNSRFASALASQGRGNSDDIFLVNDPHLLLTPGELRRQIGDYQGDIAAFIGTPWCSADYFRLLPARLRKQIVDSLLSCDVVGFQHDRWRRAFVECCLAEADGATWSEVTSTLTCGSRPVRIVTCPFPLDQATVERIRSTAESARKRRDLREVAAGRKIVVRADRVDIWKNFDRGMLAIERALEEDQTLADRVLFVIIISPATRENREQAAIRRRLYEKVQRINCGFDQKPIVVIEPGKGEDSRRQVLAALGVASVAFVNSIFDGYNMFVKEAEICMCDESVIIVSENVGAVSTLSGNVVCVDPFDVGAQATALLDALKGKGASLRSERASPETGRAWLDLLMSSAP